jgi:hypothetical protein
MDEQPRLSADHLLEPAAGLTRTSRKFAIFPLSPAKEMLIQVIKNPSHRRLVEAAIVVQPSSQVGIDAPSSLSDWRSAVMENSGLERGNSC